MVNIYNHFSNPQRHHPWLERGLKFLKKGLGSFKDYKRLRFWYGFIENGLATN